MGGRDEEKEERGKEERRRGKKERKREKKEHRPARKQIGGCFTEEKDKIGMWHYVK